MSENKKLVLGFSGGLDTTYCALYLKEQGYDVHAALVNTGGFSPEELNQIEAHAHRLGVASYVTIDAVKDYYDTIVKYLVFGNVLKNNSYPLSVSAERISQALSLADYAKETGADAIAHGSTGAGNDQVRFDLVFNTVLPGVDIITPIRDNKLSREAEINWLKERSVDMNFEKSAYSINKGLWGTSVGGRETLKSKGILPEAAWPSQLDKNLISEEVMLVFEQGQLWGINEDTFDHPSQAIQALQAMAAPYAIGRDVHIGDTIIGIKGRVGFEAAAPMVIIKSHHALEKHVLTKWQLNLKDQLAQFYGNYLHEGLVMDPVMRDIEAFFTSSQHHVSGKVFVQLLPYRFVVTGIESAFDLMNTGAGIYGEMNNSWTGEDIKGFTKIFGNQVGIYNQVKQSGDVRKN
ncbi:MAG: argininosuccinate synthase domain-containing protein [Ferruginibacter sp.]